MEALDSDNMLNNAHQLLHPTEMVHSGTVNGRNEHVSRGHQPTIGQVVYIFLDNIKVSRCFCTFHRESSSSYKSSLHLILTIEAPIWRALD